MSVCVKVAPGLLGKYAGLAGFCAAAIACVVACNGVGNHAAPDTVAGLAEDAFRCGVEPMFIRDCSYNACHGNAGFAFRVYSVGKLRLGDSSTLDTRTAPLTEDEHHANFMSALGMTYPNVAPDDNFLLRKPLPERDGGYEHKGGAIYTGPDDPRVTALRNWLHGDPVDCPPAARRHR
jgi:hypothetical protein